MDDPLLENLTPASINQIAWEIRDGFESPENAKRLMMLFCECVRQNSLPPIELLNHFKDAFQSILDDTKTPERALGLTRKKSRPKADKEVRTYMALDVLRLRLHGKSHQDALQDTSDKFGWGLTTIADAWAEYKQDALSFERVLRQQDNYPWSNDEVIRLAEIFNNEQWFITPEKSATKVV